MNKSKSHSLDEIDDIIKRKFGLNPVNDIVNVEVVSRESDPERYDRMRALFEAGLDKCDNSEEVLRRSYFGETFAIHLQSTFPRSEIEGISLDLAVHYPICSTAEILRIQTPTTAADQLLILRANAIADNARLKRVFLRRREKGQGNWSLTAHFESDHFQRYLSELPHKKRIRCREVPAGIAFLREPNGACIRSAHGDFIVISEALRNYLYYMNVFLFEQGKLPMDDCMAALMIALRTMFLTESPDLDLDPRGHLPESIDQRISNVVDDQMQFVIGHEYSHLLLNHLDGKCVGSLPLSVIPAVVQEHFQYYTPRQNQELAADASALLDPQLSDDGLANRLMGAIWFFLGLEIFYGVSEYITPSICSPKTHPPPIDRIWALREKVLSTRSLDSENMYSEDQLTQAIEWVKELKALLLKEFVPYQVDALERYGSVYLPSYRGPALYDRVDY